MESDKLTIFNIQRYSLHDGDGIRTIIFLKGCPLRCKWCSNPESQNPAPEPMKHRKPSGDGYETITVGREATITELVQEALKDAAFYGDDGGVTLSGGEPLLQDHVIQLLQALKEEYLNIAIETCGAVPTERLLTASKYLDHIFFDIKHVDSEKHKSYTGSTGEQIRENLEALAEVYPQKQITVRTPVIPGFNDSPEELAAIERFLFQFPDIEWQKLPYHTYGVHKYELLGRTYEMPDMSRQ